ncbi:MAG: hypothetical protein KIS92_04465 [Planctomycetota bacterium]|nr:hypothetical protein [Planctomycetota bacterium]
MSEEETKVMRRVSLPPIGGGSSITVGILITIVSALVGLFVYVGGSVWWAASMQTKMDFVVEQTTKMQTDKAAAEKEIQDLKFRITVLESQVKKP